MKALLKFSLMGVLTLILAACSGSGSSGGGGSSGSPTPTPSQDSNAPQDDSNNSEPAPLPESMETYTEAELNQDTANIATAEKNLESVGFIFKADSAFQNDAYITTYSWDAAFLKNYRDSHRSAKPQDAFPKLQKYSGAVADYLQKYGSPFYLKTADGSTEVMKLIEVLKTELRAKLQVTSETLSAP